MAKERKKVIQRESIMFENFLTHYAFVDKALLFVKNSILALFLSYQLRAEHIYDVQFDVFHSFRRVSDGRRGFGVSC
jgi:hypothetical protein